MNTKYRPLKNLGPGYSIRRDMEANDWNQKDLADILGASEKHISRLLNNKEPVTINTAKLLAKAFYNTPQFWINLDTNYRLRLEETAQEKTTAAKALIYRYMPIRDMRNKGWLPKDDNKLIAAIKCFWNIKELKFDFIDQKAAACFRKSDKFNHFNPFYAVTWLRKAEAEAAKETTNSYSPEKLLELANSIPILSTQSDGLELFIKKLNDAGVCFLRIPHLEKTYIDGASFLYKQNPVIAYTARHNRIDNFWFTITHEIAHVLKHLSRSNPTIIDNMDELDTENQQEIEADNFSSQILKTEKILTFFEGMQRISKARIKECANKLNIAQAIIVGCLQHHKIMPYSSMRELLPKVVIK